MYVVESGFKVVNIIGIDYIFYLFNVIQGEMVGFMCIKYIKMGIM